MQTQTQLRKSDRMTKAQIRRMKADFKREDQEAVKRDKELIKNFTADFVKFVSQYPSIEFAVVSNFLRRNNEVRIPADQRILFWGPREQATKKTATRRAAPATRTK